MPLSDVKLRAYLATGELKVSELEDRHVQSASIDVHLGYKLLVPKRNGAEYAHVDLGAGADISDRYDQVDMRGVGGCHYLYPGDFVLGATNQRVSFSNRLCGHFTGRSTLGRVGLLVHVTAGFCDPGFEGCITLEIKNLAPYAIILRPGIGIGQILVECVDGVVSRKYGDEGLGSAYTGANDGPVPPNLARKL